MKSLYVDWIYYARYEDNSDKVVKILPRLEEIGWKIYEKKRKPLVTFGSSVCKDCEVTLDWELLNVLSDQMVASIPKPIKIKQLTWDYVEKLKNRNYHVDLMKKYKRGNPLRGTVNWEGLFEFKKFMNDVIDLKESDPFSNEKQLLILAKEILEKREFLESEEFGIDETILGSNAKHVQFCLAFDILYSLGCFEGNIRSVNFNVPIDKTAGVYPHCDAVVSILPNLKRFVLGEKLIDLSKVPHIPSNFSLDEQKGILEIEESKVYFNITSTQFNLMKEFYNNFGMPLSNKRLSLITWKVTLKKLERLYGLHGKAKINSKTKVAIADLRKKLKAGGALKFINIVSYKGYQLILVNKK